MSDWWIEHGCTCEFGVRPLGRLYGVDMGSSQVLTKKDPHCPLHVRELPGLTSSS